MLFFVLLLFPCSVSLTRSKEPWDPESHKLPRQFRFGVSSSAYQIEGAWEEDGKGESIWDNYLHNKPSDFAKGPNGDVACDSYHQYKRDVEMLRELGVDYYKFSISWSRVLPTGFANNVNEKGLQYYKNLTEELHKYKIEPMAVMYHNDLPQALQDLGGWANPKIVEWFLDYADVLFSNLPLVVYWIPINEPSICIKMYDGLAKVAPNVHAKGVGDYKCIKNMLLAHAKAYRLYKKKYTYEYNTFAVGVALRLDWADPINHINTSKELNESARIFREFLIDLYVHPIYSKEGDFPETVKRIIAENSKLKGCEQSRLPELSKEEIELIRGSSDFLGINHYTSYYVEKPKPGEDFMYTMFPKDLRVRVSQRESWVGSKTPWIRATPYGLYRICIYLNEKYNHPPLLITEFGFSTDPGLVDSQRVQVLVESLKAVIYALTDNSDLRTFTVWSLMDSIEWTAGTEERFGLYEVDFDSPNKTRTPRLSANYFRQLIDTGLIKEEIVPFNEDLSISISPRKAEERETGDM